MINKQGFEKAEKLLLFARGALAALCRLTDGHEQAAMKVQGRHRTNANTLRRAGPFGVAFRAVPGSVGHEALQEAVGIQVLAQLIQSRLAPMALKELWLRAVPQQELGQVTIEERKR